MAQTAFDIVAFAKRINRRRKEWNRLHPGRRIPITAAMSRILENDDEYLPYRPRAKRKRAKAAVDPRLSTIVAIAAALGTTVGDLLGEVPDVISQADRRAVMERLRYIAQLLGSIYLP